MGSCYPECMVLASTAIATTGATEVPIDYSAMNLGF
jgi:hypothetical protein